MMVVVGAPCPRLKSDSVIVLFIILFISFSFFISFVVWKKYGGGKVHGTSFFEEQKNAISIQTRRTLNSIRRGKKCF